jgi:predicted PurR-regulated permease PerM
MNENGRDQQSGLRSEPENNGLVTRTKACRVGDTVTKSPIDLRSTLPRSMPSHKSKPSAADALAILSTVALTSFVVATLYFASEILIPLALATLLTFLLAPLVSRIERWLGRGVAVLLVVAMIFTATGAVGWVLTRQVIDLATKLPDYKVNIVAKLHAFRVPESGAFSAFSKTIEELKNELPGGSAVEPAPTMRQSPSKPGTATISPPAPPATIPTRVFDSTQSNAMDLIQSMIEPVLGPIGTSALVLLLVIFMLLQREDLRNRLIRLIGEGRISATTLAMDDAGQRVSRYLLMQLVVNVTYGIPVAIGLYFIGVPNAILWGGLATVLRFIPYIGPWIGASMPILLSLAVSSSWWTPLLTIGLFVLLELISNNIIEPWLYGSSTGVSSIALIVAAVFWTWLWGPVGLVLATPLTVCLVVLGRHVPWLSFLSVVLSDEEALTPAEDCYYRLLTPGDHDEIDFVEAYLQKNSLAQLYDTVFIPVIITAEMDALQDSLGTDQLLMVEQSLRDIIQDLCTRPPVVSKSDNEQAIADVAPMPPSRVVCLPARAVRDELAGLMLRHLLQQQGSDAWSAPGKLVEGELLALLEKADADVVCISVVEPSTVIHARYLCLNVRAQFPRIKIVVGLWGDSEGVTEATKSLRESGADEVVVSLADAVLQIAKLTPLTPEPMAAAPIPLDDEVRLAVLRALHLLDTDAEAVFDRITAKLARAFEVPIALISLVDRDRLFFKSQTGLPGDLARSREAPREVSVCGHVVANNEITVIEDLARDGRFASNPWIKARGLRFYAGAPLHAPGGQPIGSLCLLDTRPRPFSSRDQRHLQEYASEVMEEIAKRAQRTPEGNAPAKSADG